MKGLLYAEVVNETEVLTNGMQEVKSMLCGDRAIVSEV